MPYYQQMNKQKTFIEIFNEQQEYEDQIAKKWGYNSLKQSPVFTPASKTLFFQSRKTNLNENMNPLQIEKQQLPMREKFVKFLKQQQDYHYEKQLVAQRENSTNPVYHHEINTILNDKIKQFNNMADHKHLKRETNTIKHYQENSKNQILQQIEELKSRLLRAKNMTEETKISSKMLHLYKKFNNRPTHHSSTHKSMTRRPTSASDRKNTRRGSLNITALTIHKQKPSSSMSILEGSKINIRDPMQIKHSQKRYQKLTNELKLKNRQRDIYKSKVEQRVNEYMQYHQKSLEIKNRKKQRDTKKLAEQTSEQFSNELYEEFEEGESSAQIKEPTSAEMSELKNQRKEEKGSEKIIEYQRLQAIRQHQQLCLSTCLSKNNRKFKKASGNNILIKYDSMKEAEKMLDGGSCLKMRSRANNQSNNGRSVASKRSKYQNKDLIQSRLNELEKCPLGNSHQIEETRLYLDIIEVDGDEQLRKKKYKNEKINMFLSYKE